MLKLYHGVTSTCSKRVRITLAEKDLAWESHHLLLAERENLEPWYLKLNPNGVVPTLDHDGRILYESNVIIEYLDEAFPEVPLRPANPFARANMRIWMDRIEHVLHRNINIVSWNKQGRYKRFQGMTDDQLQDRASLRTEGHPDSDFARPLLDGKREHPVKADRSKDQCLILGF